MSAFISDSIVERAAPGHLPGGTRAKAWTTSPNLAGIGMVKASLADMDCYARAGLGDGPADVVARMRRTQMPVAHGFGMNWMRRSLQGRDILLHEGGTGGFSSLVALDPARHQAVVLLADTAWTDLGGLGDIGLSLLGSMCRCDGRLMVQGTGQPAIAAMPIGPDRIEIAQVGAIVDFERNASGQVVAAVLKQGGQVLRGLRR